jgi:hypothetical protein
MKKIIIAIFTVTISLTALQAQKIATGKWAALIEKGFVKDSEIKELKGYTYYMSTVLTLDTPSLSLTVYKKGATHIIVMTLEEDGIKTITDVLEVKDVKSNQQFLISQCTRGNEMAPDLIVLVQNPPANSLKAKPLKAWRANRDKIHFEKTGLTNLKCFFEDP